MFDAALTKGRGANGVFGVRIQHKSLQYVLDQLAGMYPDLTTDRARIDAAFGPTVFVHLTRGDKLAQAVSFVKAQQTGLWHQAPDGRELERLSPPQTPVYDPQQIRHWHDSFVAADAGWRHWFATQSIAPLRITHSLRPYT